jgi:type 1 glutamine amidotransferase
VHSPSIGVRELAPALYGDENLAKLKAEGCSLSVSNHLSGGSLTLPEDRMRYLRHGLTIVLLLAAASGQAFAQEKTTKRNLLFIGQSKGYQHDSVSTAMATLFNLGRSSGKWNTFFRTDCTAITKKPLKWGAKNLSAFDAVVFFTDGDLDMDDSQKADLLSFVRDDGKGFIGIHSATITFTSWREYGKMIGGYYDEHPWGVFNAPLVVEDTSFPGMSNLPQQFMLRDEIYQLKDYSRANVRVLMRLDAGKIDLKRKGVKRKDNDFAVMWARDYGMGRVLYNGLGHQQDVWERPDIQKMWVDQVQWVMGSVPGDATPRAMPAE